MTGMMYTPGMMPGQGMMQAPGMMHAPGMMPAPGMAAPGACGYQPLPPGGLVNLDVDVAPGFVTLDTDYPPRVMRPVHEFSQTWAQASYEETKTYTVQKGDTVYKIAKRYGTTMNAIIQANNLHNPNLIFPGQVLYIPA